MSPTSCRVDVVTKVPLCRCAVGFGGYSATMVEINQCVSGLEVASRKFIKRELMESGWRESSTFQDSHWVGEGYEARGGNRGHHHRSVIVPDSLKEILAPTATNADVPMGFSEGRCFSFKMSRTTARLSGSAGSLLVVCPTRRPAPHRAARCLGSETWRGYPRISFRWSYSLRTQRVLERGVCTLKRQNCCCWTCQASACVSLIRCWQKASVDVRRSCTFPCQQRSKQAAVIFGCTWRSS